MSEIARLEPLCCGSLVNQKKSLVRRPLGAVKLADNVIDPPNWCGTATTTLYGGRGDPLSFVGKLLSGKRDQGDRDCVHGRDLIARKRYSS